MSVPERALSPTQITTYIACPRAWGIERIDGIRSTGNKFAWLGQDVHKHFDGWFRFNQMPPSDDAGEIARSGLHMWPAPHPDMEVEVSIECETTVSKYHGFQDIGFFEGRYVQDIGFFEGRYVVGDHKTTSDFRWAKTGDDLKTDVQANIYALAAMNRHGVDEVELRWGYVRTKGARKAQKVSLIVQRDQVEKFIRDEVDPIAAQIHHAYATVARGLDMAPNPLSCDRFGGCSHRKRIEGGAEVGTCDLTPTERLKAHMTMMKLKDRLAAQKAEREAAAPETPKDLDKGEVAAGPAATKEAPAAINPPEAAKVKPPTPPKVERPNQGMEPHHGHTETKPAATTVHGTPPKQSRILLIDCSPIDARALQAGDVVARAQTRVQMDNGSLAKHHTLCDFGHGRGELVKHVAAELADAEGFLILRTSNPDERDALSAFQAWANIIIQG